MPTITNPCVIQTIVETFLSNGMDKCNALVKTGYKLNYARSTKGMKLFDRSDVKAELRKQREELAKKTGFSKEQASVDLDEDRQLARELKQPSAAISATNTKMRLYGMDQIAGTDNVDTKPLTPEEQQIAQQTAQAIIKHRQGPKLVPKTA